MSELRFTRTHSVPPDFLLTGSIKTIDEDHAEKVLLSMDLAVTQGMKSVLKRELLEELNEVKAIARKDVLQLFCQNCAEEKITLKGEPIRDYQDIITLAEMMKNDKEREVFEERVWMAFYNRGFVRGDWQHEYVEQYCRATNIKFKQMKGEMRTTSFHKIYNQVKVDVLKMINRKCKKYDYQWKIKRASEDLDEKSRKKRINKNKYHPFFGKKRKGMYGKSVSEM